MTQQSPYVIHPLEQPYYSPANHTGTRNYRLVGPKTNGSRYLEIALGDIERHEGSPAHAHPDLEQAVYIIEGEATVEVDGVLCHVKTGDLMYFPPKVFHDIRVESERIRILVIYSPPFEEAPVMRREPTEALV
jgi:quercetin dioxygenase-like cupin family protein